MSRPRQLDRVRRSQVSSPGRRRQNVSALTSRKLDAERLIIKEVLDEVRWNRVEAARCLKISYKALLYKIAMHGLAPGQKNTSPDPNVIS